jgi:hypothetical protein
VIDAQRQPVLGALADPAKQSVSISSMAWSSGGKQVAIGSVIPQSGKDRYLIQVWSVAQASH